MSGESIAKGAPEVLKGVEDDGLEGIGNYDDPRTGGVNSALPGGIATGRPCHPTYKIRALTFP
jgi:hypothetical protein